MNGTKPKRLTKGARLRLTRMYGSLLLAVLALGVQRCAKEPPVTKIQPMPAAVTEESMPADSHPTAITRGPDGNLWFTETESNRVGRRAPDGTVAQFTLPHANSGPAAMAVGPDARLWFTEMDGARIGAISTGGVIQEYPLETGRVPTGITLGADGVIWFTEEASDGHDRIGRITPAGAITELMTPTAAAMPAGMVKGRDASLFFVESSANKIARIPATGSPAAAIQRAAVSNATASAVSISEDTIREYTIPTDSAGAASIALGSDGAVWFTETAVDKVARLDPDTGVITEFHLPTTNANATGIVAGPDCNLWFTENNANLIGRVTTAGVITEFRPSAGSDPTDITVGTDGNLWYTQSGPGVLTMLPVTNHACLDNNLPPVATCKDATVNTDAGVCTAAAASVDNGSSDPDGNLDTSIQSPAGPYALGATTVELRLTDALDAIASCDAQVTVVDNQPPTVSCTAPVVECTSPAGAAVMISASAADNCAGALAAPACTPPSGSIFALGATSFSCTATDAAGNRGACNSTVTVRDTTPPSIASVSASPAVLWPPNHKWVPVTIAVSASDSCDGAPKCTITGVTANEPITGEDWKITGPLTVSLEAERSGAGTGRVFQVAVECVDASGNSSTGAAAVSVPHDLGQP
jgi:streptogramin lyase